MLRVLVLLGTWPMTFSPSSVTGSAVAAIGWLDCSGSAPDARSVQRAWRRMALQSHPDKTGSSSSEGFEEMTKLRDALKDPDKFQIHRLLNGLAELRPFGTIASELRVTSADLKVRRQCTDVLDQSTCFPYAVLTSDFALSKDLPPGATWTFALGAKNISTIQYHGSEEAGGYDACCDLRKDSVCVRRSAESVPSASDGSAGRAGPCGQGNVDSDARQCTDSDISHKPPKGVVYESHDCPMGDVFSTEVSRPLHVMAPGLWAATLSIRSAEGSEIACVAATLLVREQDVRRPDDDSDVTSAHNDSAEHLDPHSKGPHWDERGTVSDQSGGDPKQNAAPTERESSLGNSDSAAVASFAFFDRGVYCEDGIDILEGAMDDYSVSECGGSQQMFIVCLLPTQPESLAMLPLGHYFVRWSCMLT